MLLNRALVKHIKLVNHLHMKSWSVQHCWTNSPVHIKAVMDQVPGVQSLVWGLLLSTGSAKLSNYVSNVFTHLYHRDDDFMMEFVERTHNCCFCFEDMQDVIMLSQSEQQHVNPITSLIRIKLIKSQMLFNIEYCLSGFVLHF